MSPCSPADLRLHDNPVLQAALRDADRVVPLLVVDAGIRRAGFAVPNRAAFLADSLADLDGAMRQLRHEGWMPGRA